MDKIHLINIETDKPHQSSHLRQPRQWIPASAGMTEEKVEIWKAVGIVSRFT